MRKHPLISQNNSSDNVKPSYADFDSPLSPVVKKYSQKFCLIKHFYKNLIFSKISSTCSKASRTTLTGWGRKDGCRAKSV